MGRWDEQWSEAQRRAIGDFLLEPDPLTGKKRTVPECREALMAGRLKCEVPPEAPPQSTFYYFKRREEQRRKGEVLSPLARQALQDPEAVRESIIRRAVSVWEHDQDKLEDYQRKGKVNPQLFGQQIKNTPTVLGLLKQAKGNAKPKATTNPEREEQPVHDDPLKALVSAHEASSRGVAQ